MKCKLLLMTFVICLAVQLTFASATSMPNSDVAVIDYRQIMTDTIEYVPVETQNVISIVPFGISEKQSSKTFSYKVQLDGTFIGYQYIDVVGMYSQADNYSRIVSVTSRCDAAGASIVSYINGNSALAELYLGSRFGYMVYYSISTNGTISAIS